MPTTHCAEPNGVTLFADPAQMPAACQALFAPGADLGSDAGSDWPFFTSQAWYRTVIDHAMKPGEEACFAVWREAGRPAAVFPMRRRAGRIVESLTTPYNCMYSPLIAPGLDRAATVRAGFALGRLCRGAAQVRLDALASEWPGLEALLDGVRRSGLLVRRFDHFGNWHEPVAGLSWNRYLEARPGALRETVRRKLGKAGRNPSTRVEIVTSRDDLEAGIDAFERVYRRSWKQPEPFPGFQAGLMRRMAPLGLLRLAILRIGAEPAAVQLWIVQNGQAMVLKLAHDEAFKTVSPGTVLTAAVLRRLLDEERVVDIDFGRGDDPYKRQWASRRRQRIGLLLINPFRPAGLATLGLHALGRGRRAALSVVGRLPTATRERD